MSVDFSPLKRAFLAQCLDKGTTQIFVVPAVPGVQLPHNFMRESVVNLNLFTNGRRPPINLTDAAIETELNFGGQWSPVIIPWHAIGMIRHVLSGTSQVYDTPELNAAAKAAEAATAAPGKLKLVKLDGCEEHETTPPRNPSLYIVK